MSPPHLEVSRAPVQVQVDVFDLPKFSESVVHVLLRGLLVHPCHKQDPALHGWAGKGGVTELGVEIYTPKFGEG